MMHPETYLRARRTARFHVQVQIREVQLPSEYPGEARVVALVDQVFRGNDHLACGEQIKFRLSVIEHLDQMQTDGTMWVLAHRVVAGQLLEVFLNGAPPDCEVALWQSALIERVSLEPQMTLDEL